ncbi:PilX N-terminal domain-containing pilus assembly protein [Thalassomonas sp. M1454]|uniref:PilX N-terminal domain-containing pilus assembly protein n=1 Tax=Thalassomonas sp. M1454 TaxID=2594477 RepID=UPI00163DAC57|nr:PilX N-terminal domain-containing pilus assembly protein [Thalassomonas sp. M1454]
MKPRNINLMHMKKQQQGMAVLVISIILLVLITLISLYLARSVLVEQKMVSNDFRARQAFDNAEAGLALAMEAISDDKYWDEDGNVLGVFDLDAGDGINDSNTGDLDNGSVSINVITVVINELDAYTIESTGLSDDGTASRTVTADMRALNPLPNIPDNPLSTKGTIILGGSATIHNPEGHSTIWSGGDVDVGSNNSTETTIADPSDPNYPRCMDDGSCNTVETSSRDKIGLDIIEHDSDLANLTAAEMFENFFGMSPERYKEVMSDVIIGGPDARGECGNTWNGCVDGSQNDIIWYDGDVSENGGSMGCAQIITGGNVCAENDQRPSVLVIDGDLDLQGTPHFYGIVYVMGSILGTGNSTFHGALIVAGDLANSTSGSLDAHYDSSLLKKIKDNGPKAVGAGSWKDF